MLPLEDIAFQLVALPPISSKRTEPWIAGVLQTVDAGWLVVDLADPACAEHLLAICTEPAQRRITLSDRWPDLSADSDTQRLLRK